MFVLITNMHVLAFVLVIIVHCISLTIDLTVRNFYSWKNYAVVNNNLLPSNFLKELASKLRKKLTEAEKVAKEASTSAGTLETEKEELEMKIKQLESEKQDLEKEKTDLEAEKQV